MRFKVTHGFNPNPSITIVGSDGTTPYDLDWLIEKVFDIYYAGVKRKRKKTKLKMAIFEKLKALEMNRGYSVENPNGQLKLLILRVPDTYDLADVFTEQFGHL